MKCIILTEEPFSKEKHIDNYLADEHISYKSSIIENEQDEMLISGMDFDDVNLVIRTAGYELHRLAEKGISNENVDIEMVDDQIYVYYQDEMEAMEEEYGIDWNDLICGELNSWYSYFSLIEIE